MIITKAQTIDNKPKILVSIDLKELAMYYVDVVMMYSTEDGQTAAGCVKHAFVNNLNKGATSIVGTTQDSFSQKIGSLVGINLTAHDGVFEVVGTGVDETTINWVLKIDIINSLIN
ncbi:MAG: hypothetical protein Q8P81_00665 [Nanoarchaeota archaeon]|nr:hypothetical protein [Nanoarchaeota archaeon]